MFCGLFVAMWVISVGAVIVTIVDSPTACVGSSQS